jgi:uncharacterized cupin superfamily protein
MVHAEQSDCLNPPPRRRCRVLRGARGIGGAVSMARIGTGVSTQEHVRIREDEWFLVKEGRSSSRLGEREEVLEPGDFAFGPREEEHG